MFFRSKYELFANILILCIDACVCVYRFIANVMIHRKIIFGFPILTWVPKND